ncbi:hypothetical protein LTR85_005964 [Meristemomyces frigidus]|nr:hypothetical protein LTR85_005964 [Meristemomyces frigidus]
MNTASFSRTRIHGILQALCILRLNISAATHKTPRSVPATFDNFVRDPNMDVSTWTADAIASADRAMFWYDLVGFLLTLVAIPVVAVALIVAYQYTLNRVYLFLLGNVFFLVAFLGMGPMKY